MRQIRVAEREPGREQQLVEQREVALPGQQAADPARATGWQRSFRCCSPSTGSTGWFAGLGRLRPADHQARVADRPRPAPERQAEVLAIVVGVGVVVDRAEGLQLDGYSHFCIRDADSSQPGCFTGSG